MSKVIFLVGGPGSGKDIILKNVLSRYAINEYKLEQLKTIPNHSFVVSTTASNLDSIKHLKETLESNDYQTAMIFVHVSEQTSINRIFNQESITSRKEKYQVSLNNLYEFYDIFDNFIKFNNDTLLEDISFKEVNKFCRTFLNVQDSLLEKTLKRTIKNKLKKNPLNPVSADSVNPQYYERIPPVYDYYAQFEDVEFSYSGYPDMSAFASDSRGKPPIEYYRDKEIEYQQPKTIKRLKKLAREKDGKIKH